MLNLVFLVELSCPRADVIGDPPDEAMISHQLSGHTPTRPHQATLRQP